MSAVDEYRASELWNVTLPEETGEGTLYRPGVPVVRKSLADAAIAELEAELAAVKGRRCETCKWWNDRDDCPVSDFDTMEDLAGQTPADFACNRWAEREKP